MYTGETRLAAGYTWEVYQLQRCRLGQCWVKHLARYPHRHSTHWRASELADLVEKEDWVVCYVRCWELVWNPLPIPRQSSRLMNHSVCITGIIRLYTLKNFGLTADPTWDNVPTIFVSIPFLCLSSLILQCWASRTVYNLPRFLIFDRKRILICCSGRPWKQQPRYSALACLL
jgi:hypothetical protein